MKYNKSHKDKAIAEISEQDSRITAQDLFNSFACLYDAGVKEKAKRMLENALLQIRSDIDAKKPLTLWVDGSYNPKLDTAGIGIVIIPDMSDPAPGSPGNIIFGKAVKAKSSLEAEIYALSIGLSYILDTYPGKDHIHVKYDCVNSTVCAVNIESLSSLGAPYTNFKSALKRIRKKKISVVFEHVKAHENDAQNERCDLLAKYYSKAKLPAAQLRIIKKLLKGKN